MKKQFRSITIVVAILALVVMLVPASVLAANDEPMPAKGNLYIHKYLMDDTSGALDTNNDGKELDPATDLPAGATALDGITFDIYQITIPTTGANAGVYPTDGAYTLIDPSDASAGFKDSAGITFAVAPASTATATTGADGTAKALSLTAGLYFVVEEPDSRVDSPSAPFVVAVPMANPDYDASNPDAGSAWLTDVHVYPKNEALTLNKTVDKSSVKVGDPLTWTLTAGVPSDLADTTNYAITDQLDSALTYTGHSAIVGGKDVAGLDTPDITLTEGASADYTVSPTSATDGALVKVTFTDVGLKKLIDNDIHYLRLSITTTVNAAVLNKSEVDNTADITFVNNQGDERDIKSNGDTPVEIHTGTIDIVKEDGADHSVKLPGATFVIASSLTNANAEDFLKYDPVTMKIYDFGETGYDGATLKVLTASTSTTGTASFTGLLDYVYNTTTKANDYKDYYLVETAAPAGYNPLTSPVKVSFSAATSTKSTNYTITATIDNYKGFTLPKTGASGVIVFMVVGIVLIGGAIMLSATGKKREGVKN